MGTICGCILVTLVGVGGNLADSVRSGEAAMQHAIGPELVVQTEPAHLMDRGGAIDTVASLLMAPGAVRAVWADSHMKGDPFWPGPPAPPAGGRTFSWLFAGAIGAAFVTFVIIAATASSGD